MDLNYSKLVKLNLVEVSLIGINRSNIDLKKSLKKNQDQATYGLSLWYCLYGICMEEKYRFEMSFSNISSFADASYKKKSCSIGLCLRTFLDQQVLAHTLFV